MNYLVVMDSCGEMTKEMKNNPGFIRASLSIDVDDYHIIDDETFNQKEFLARVAASPNAPKSACPSPDIYKEAFLKGADHVFAVTLSSELSGSYNSALIGREMALEEQPDMNIHVFNSRSASIGETLISLKIMECEEKAMGFDEIVDTVEAYIDTQQTWFVLESLETLRKNGRLSNLKAKVASVLNIKPVMISTPEGNIAQLTQARGINKALIKMVENIVEITENPEEKTLAISHCNCIERAVLVKNAILERIPLKEVIILDTDGISSMYANDGGIILVV